MVLILYGAGAALLAAAAAAVGRPIPRLVLALFVAAPLLAFLPDFSGGRTRLPADQTYHIPDASPPSPPHNPWLNDLASQFLPWAVKTRAAWRSGELPLRDPWNGCGSAFVGGPAAPFSPFSIFYVFLPITRAFGAAAALRAFAALAGSWLWLRELGASTCAALFGAVSFALSFAIAPWIFFPIAAGVAAWPWVFFGVERLRDRAAGERRVGSTGRAELGTGFRKGRAGGERRAGSTGRAEAGTGFRDDPQGRRRAFAFLVAVFAVWPLFGHVESVFSGLCLLAVVLAARRLSGDLSDALPLSGRVLAAGAAGAGLAAFVLLPQAYAILASNRRAIAREYLFHLPWTWIPHGFQWAGWRTTLFPRAFGDLIEAPMLPGIARAAFTEMALGYVGIVCWAFALLVLRPGSSRARITPALIAAIVLSLGLGLGLWPLAEIAERIPVLSWMLPVRLLAWIAFAASTLGALELDRWRRDVEGPSARLAAAVAVAAAAGLALLAWDTHRRYYAALGPPTSVPAAAAGLRLTLWTLAALALAAALPALRLPEARRAAPWLVLGIAAVELSLEAARLYKTFPAREVYPPTPMTGFFRGRPGRWRVVGQGSEFFPQRNAVVGVEDIRTHDPTERRDYVEFLDVTLGYPPADYYKRVGRIDAPVLAFLNARYMVSHPDRGPSGPWRPVYWGPDGSVLENTRVLPRVFAPARVVGMPGTPPRGGVIDGLEPFRGALADIAALDDFGRRAFVLGAPEGERANGPAEVGGYEETGRRVRFLSRAEAPTTLVSSLVQDGGWTAKDGEGRRLPTTLANGPFLAVTVPAGATRVRLDYAPPGWRAGVAISVVTASLLAASAWRAGRLAAA